jgi:hypothetical protein
MWSVRLRFAAASAATALVLAGCGGAGMSPAGGDVQRDPAVRFVNVSPDAAALAFFLNDEAHARDLAYGASTPAFVRVEHISDEDDGYDVSVAPSAGGEEYDRVAASLARDTNTVVVAFGLADPGTEFLKRLQIGFVPVPTQPPIGERARLLVFNGMVRTAGSEPVALTLQTIDPDDPFSQDNPQFIIRDLGFGEFSPGANTLEVDSGELTFQVRRADVDGVNVVTQSPATLRGGATYLALIIGQEDAVDPARRPELRMVEVVPIN